MRRFRYPPVNSGGVVALAALTLTIGSGATRADNAAAPDLPAQIGLRGGLDGSGDLQLEVFINDWDTKTVIGVVRARDGGFLVKRSELEAAGIKPPLGPPDTLLRLDAIKGLTYRYDEPRQLIYFTAPDSLRAPHIYNLAARNSSNERASSAIGAALNYDAYASSAAWSLGHPVQFGAAH